MRVDGGLMGSNILGYSGYYMGLGVGSFGGGGFETNTNMITSSTISNVIIKVLQGPVLGLIWD